MMQAQPHAGNWQDMYTTAFAGTAMPTESNESSYHGSRKTSYLAAGGAKHQRSYLMGSPMAQDSASSTGGAHRRQSVHSSQQPYMNQPMNAEFLYKMYSPTQAESEDQSNSSGMMTRDRGTINRYQDQFGIPENSSRNQDAPYSLAQQSQFSLHDGMLSGNEMRTAAAANSTSHALRLAEMSLRMHDVPGHASENSLAFLGGPTNMGMSSQGMGQHSPLGDDSAQRALQDLALENVHLKQRLQQAQQDILRLQGCLRQVHSEGTKPKRERGQSRYWTNEEHQRFVDAVEQYGPRDVKMIAQCVGTRSPTQVRTHAQKYFIRLSRQNKTRDNGSNYNSGSEGQGNYSESGSGKDNSSLSAAETIQSGGSGGSESFSRNMYDGSGDNSQSSASPEASDAGHGGGEQCGEPY